MEVSILTIIVALLISVLIGGLFMWMGARMAGVVLSSYGNAVMAALWVALIMWLIPYIFAYFFGAVTTGWIIAIILSLFAIQGSFGTSFLRALLVWVFSIVAQLVVAFLLTLIFGIEFGLLFDYSF